MNRERNCRKRKNPASLPCESSSKSSYPSRTPNPDSLWLSRPPAPSRDHPLGSSRETLTPAVTPISPSDCDLCPPRSRSVCASHFYNPDGGETFCLDYWWAGIYWTIPGPPHPREQPRLRSAPGRQGAAPARMAAPRVRGGLRR